MCFEHWKKNMYLEVMHKFQPGENLNSLHMTHWSTWCMCWQWVYAPCMSEIFMPLGLLQLHLSLVSLWPATAGVLSNRLHLDKNPTFMHCLLSIATKGVFMFGDPIYWPLFELCRTWFPLFCVVPTSSVCWQSIVVLDSMPTSVWPVFYIFHSINNQRTLGTQHLEIWGTCHWFHPSWIYLTFQSNCW